MRLLSEYDLFIFDWDHTLTTSTLAVGLLGMARAHSKKARAEKLRNMSSADFSAKNVEVKEEVSRIYSFFDDVYSFVFCPRLKRDAVPLLEFLKKRKKKVAIFSDSKAYRLLKEMRVLGVADYVDFALAAESIGRYKPDPTGLLVVMGRFRARRKRSIYIGDMAGDMLTARLAGIASVGVADGIASADELRAEKPIRVFPHLGALLREMESA